MKMINCREYHKWMGVDIHCLFLQVKGTMDGIPVMLVGNKCDEESGKREVSKKTGEALQVKLQALFHSNQKKIFCLSTGWVQVAIP